MSRDPWFGSSRRGLLGATVLAVTASACEGSSPREPATAPSTDVGASPAPEPAEDPDTELVRRVVDDLSGALALVLGAARARGPLLAELAPWRRLHAAHLEALEAPARTRPLPVRGDARTLRTRIGRAEVGLQRRLATAAVAAESGPLAALLAQMSAAVAQQLAADASRGGR